MSGQPNSEHRALMEAFAELFEQLRRLKEQNEQLQEAIARINRPVTPDPAVPTD